MTLPGPVQRAAESVLEARTGKSVRILSASAVGGGCINPSARVETEDGEAFFLKWNPASASDMFEAEADGLRAMAVSGSLTIPEVLGWGGPVPPTTPGGSSWSSFPGGGQARIMEGGWVRVSGHFTPLGKWIPFLWSHHPSAGTGTTSSAPSPRPMRQTPVGLLSGGTHDWSPNSVWPGIGVTFPGAEAEF
jgi:hypothetical protein